MTPHGLRHWFATWAMERGVDVRTVAGWLGHKDNGALLLKTYGHLRTAHSLEQAQKLQ
jgi:site-specific recombinase XerD